jgi:regulatory protein
MAKTASHTLTYEQALQRAMALCSASEHCISDINEKLYRWGLSKQDSDRVTDYLLDEKFIDERRFALAYANDKYRFSHWGRVKIRAMLCMLRISDTDISEALDSIDEQRYMEILKDVINSKRKSICDDGSYASRAKIIRFALQRGFEMHEIAKFISDYEE